MRFLFYLLPLLFVSCGNPDTSDSTSASDTTQYAVARIAPKYTTPAFPNDSDDPAIWYNEENPEQSLILGTDKFEGSGGVYIFDIRGKLDTTLQIFPLDRPNNIDIAYNLELGDSAIDIAVIAERVTGSLRVFSLPGLHPLDNGGIPVFEDSPANAVMGIALYTNPENGKIYAIVSRKENPNNNNDYLYQYELTGSNGSVDGKLVRKFGEFSGVAEIEAIAVDNELGYIYYSDESYGIRKYYADPAKSNDQLGVFGLESFTEDREGISIYKSDSLTGYILVSDQGANEFRVFPREGLTGDPNDHPEIAVISLSTLSSDGSEVMAKPFGDEFPDGIFVAMSDNRTFEIYDWRELQEVIDKAVNGNN